MHYYCFFQVSHPVAFSLIIKMYICFQSNTTFITYIILYHIIYHIIYYIILYL